MITVAILATSDGRPWEPIPENVYQTDYENLGRTLWSVTKIANQLRATQYYDNVKVSVAESRPNVRDGLALRIYHNLIIKDVMLKSFIDFKIEEDEDL